MALRQPSSLVCGLLEFGGGNECGYWHAGWQRFDNVILGPSCLSFIYIMLASPSRNPQVLIEFGGGRKGKQETQKRREEQL
jgi:hypothetical protein